jgi:hypothetical protein
LRFFLAGGISGLDRPSRGNSATLRTFAALATEMVGCPMAVRLAPAYNSAAPLAKSPGVVDAVELSNQRGLVAGMSRQSRFLFTGAPDG